jgi:2,3-diketo-5-methylthiopentyl-1-phosphate enolase
MKIDRILFSTPEGVGREAYVIATYLAEYETSQDISKAAAVLAVEQSTGTWMPIHGETAELRRKHLARVVAIHEIPAYEFGLPAHKETRQYIT